MNIQLHYHFKICTNTSKGVYIHNTYNRTCNGYKTNGRMIYIKARILSRRKKESLILVVIVVNA